MMITFAYPLRTISGTDYPELRYSLRSLDAHTPDTRKVFIAAQRLPSWLPKANVVQVKHGDTSGYRTMNTLAKALAVANHPECAPDFVWLHDDMIFLAPYNFREYHHRGTLLDRTGTNEYHRATRNTLAMLGAPKNFAAHRPLLFERARFVELMTPFLRKNVPLLWGTVYCTLAGVSAIPSDDVKVRTAAEFFAAVSNAAPIISTDDPVLRSGEVRAWLAERYPDQSRFEKMRKAA